MSDSLSESASAQVRIPRALPSSWGSTSLVAVCRPRQWPTISKSQLLAEGFTVFGANGPIGFFSEYTHEARTLAITCRGATCGALNLVPAKSYITGNAMALDELDETQTTLEYLHHALGYRGLADVVSGSAQPQITRQGLASVMLPMPPLGEQRKIAAILSSVDDAIEATQAVIEQLQVVKKAMMAELLTRGLPGRHTRFKQTELGEVPEDWTVVMLGDVLESIDAGWSPQCETRPAASGEWGVLKVSAVTSGVFRESEQKALPASLEARPNTEVRQGDVLLARANGVLELVGRTVFVRSIRPRLMLSDKLMRLRPITARLDSEYLSLVMGTDVVRSRLLSTTGGSHMRNVSQANLRVLRLPLPPLDEQVRVASTIAATDERIRIEQGQLASLRILKLALMSVLLTGEVRVRPDEDAA